MRNPTRAKGGEMTDKIKAVEERVREVLEELNRHIDNVRGEFTYTDDIDRNIELQISVALTQLDALYKAEYLGMLPEERVIDYNKPDFVSNNTDALYGFNSAIQEMKGKLR